MSPTHLKTGIPNLDRLLDMDAAQAADAGPGAGGILVRRPGQSSKGVPPVTLISGEAGTGKTIMALQIAWNLAHSQGRNVYLYSLEQSAAELDLACVNFGFLNGDASPLHDLADGHPPDAAKRLINFCHLTPLPISPAEEPGIFEERLLQLNHALARATAEEAKTPDPVFFLDSLNAFGTNDLHRQDIHRLFALFRSLEVPAIVTCEQGAADNRRGESLSYDARFLADIVIDLRKGKRAEYLLFDLEISKNRRSSQALGRHLYKTRTLANTKRQNLPRADSGIYVYPSIHAVLSMARQRAQPNVPAGQTPVYQLTRPPANEIQGILQKEDIEPGACIAVIGPRGTHKRALAINLATGCPGFRTDQSGESVFVPARRHLLVLSFGVYGGIGFSSTAWFAERTEWSRIKRQPERNPSEIKSWQHVFTESGDPDPTLPMATVLNFQVGNLAPEEAFHLVGQTIERSHAANQGFSAVLLCDTSEICTGFPLLRSDPLFLPTLIDLVHSHHLVFVGVGIDGADSYTTEMNAGLLAVADYRVILSHYPTTYDLSKSITDDCLSGPAAATRENKPLNEQVACIVVDNVSGHQYGRVPSWLWVSERAGAKELHYGSFADYLRGRSTPDATGTAAPKGSTRRRRV